MHPLHQGAIVQRNVGIELHDKEHCAAAVGTGQIDPALDPGWQSAHPAVVLPATHIARRLPEPTRKLDQIDLRLHQGGGRFRTCPRIEYLRFMGAGKALCIVAEIHGISVAPARLSIVRAVQTYAERHLREGARTDQRQLQFQQALQRGAAYSASPSQAPTHMRRCPRTPTLPGGMKVLEATLDLCGFRQLQALKLRTETQVETTLSMQCASRAQLKARQSLPTDCRRRFIP